MIELVYYSKANSDLTSEDISNILATARKFNVENNITGCLLFHNNEFLQILEGEREVLMGLFASIEKDERHSNIMLLATEDKNERLFSDWSMAFYEFESNEIEKKLFVSGVQYFSDFYKNPTHVMDLFLTMAKSIVD